MPCPPPVTIATLSLSPSIMNSPNTLNCRQNSYELPEVQSLGKEIWRKRFDTSMMTRLENKKSLHAQFKFEDPTSSVLRAFFVARHSADNFPGRYGCHPKRFHREIADV